ncbi:MAG: flavodoxin domain-containing protein [Bacteroidota bacterium]
MDLLIVYGTTEGHTRKIGAYLRDEAEMKGMNVSLFDATNAPLSPFTFDRTIIASSVHMHKFQDAIKHYVMEHQKELNKVQTMFLTVSLAAADDQPESWEELEDVTQTFLTDTGWNPDRIEHIAGALKFTRYNFFKRFIMRQIASKTGKDVDVNQDYEYTDWDKLRKVFNEFTSEAVTKTEPVSSSGPVSQS